jgi:hypothetical protein
MSVLDRADARDDDLARLAAQIVHPNDEVLRKSIDERDA